MIHLEPLSLKSVVKTLRILVVAALPGCGGGPQLPQALTFEGRALEKATEWSRGEISGVVFVPPGEQMPTASLQVGILVSREHPSGVQLHSWIMEQYRSSPTAQWHESSTSDEACKVGLTQGPRPFVALHVCRGASGVSACAEADEELGDDIVGRCLNTAGCWEELCTQHWTARRAALEAEVLRVLGSR
jgi:hypothetical protein